MSNIKNITDLKQELKSNIDLQNEFKEDPVKAVERIEFIDPAGSI